VATTMADRFDRELAELSALLEDLVERIDSLEGPGDDAEPRLRLVSDKEE
jgi:hypothetical protein